MDDTGLVRVALSLFFIIALILAAAWFSKRQGWLKSGDHQRLRIVSSQKLGARSSLVLVKVDDTEILLGITAQHISLLRTLPEPKSFNQHLDEASS